MATPSYLKGRKPIQIPLHSVMDILKEISDLGHSAGLGRAAKKKGAFVSVHPKTVNFIKEYLADNNLHEKSDVARKIMNACPGSDPYRCPYSKKD